jgi:hypothetical protein
MLKGKIIKQLLWDEVIQPGEKYTKELLKLEKILEWAIEDCSPKELPLESINTIKEEWELLISDVYGYTNGRRLQPNFEDLTQFNEYMKASGFADDDLDIYVIVARHIFDEIAEEVLVAEKTLE